MKLFLLDCLKIYTIFFTISGSLCTMEESNPLLSNEYGISNQEAVITSWVEDTEQLQETAKNKTEIIDKNILKVIAQDGKEFFIEREILELSPIVKNLIEDTKTQEVFIPGADGYTFAMLYELLKMVHGQVKEQEAGQLRCRSYIQRPLDNEFIHKNLRVCLEHSIESKTREEINKIIFLSHFLELPWLTNVLIRFDIDRLLPLVIEEDIRSGLRKYQSIAWLFGINEKKVSNQKLLLDKKVQDLIVQLADKVIKGISEELFICKDLLPLYHKQIKIALVDLVEFSIADYIALLSEEDKQKILSKSYDLARLTSLEGIELILALLKTSCTYLNLNQNYIIDKPENINVGAFKGIKNLYWNEGIIGLEGSDFYKKLILESNLQTLTLLNTTFSKDGDEITTKIITD